MQSFGFTSRNDLSIGLYSIQASLTKYFGPLPFRFAAQPQHCDAKIEIEPLQNDLGLLPVTPYQADIRTFRNTNGQPVRVQIKIGYREIFVKRQRLQYLTALKTYWLELAESSITTSHCYNVKGQAFFSSSSFSSSASILFPCSADHYFFSVQNYLARGGMYKRIDGPMERKPRKYERVPGHIVPKKEEKAGENQTPQFNDLKRPRANTPPPPQSEQQQQERQIVQKEPPQQKRPSDTKPIIKNPPPQQNQPEKTEEAKHESKKKDKSADPVEKSPQDKRKELEEQKKKDEEDRELYPDRYVGEDKIMEQLNQTTDPQLEFPDFQKRPPIEVQKQNPTLWVEQASLMSHFMAYRKGEQLDSEWLQLTPSSEGEMDNQWTYRDNLEIFRPPWIMNGIDHDNQTLLDSLRCFFCLLLCTCRHPFIIQPSMRNKILEVLVFRKRMYMYMFTTLFLWLYLGIISINLILLRYNRTEGDAYMEMEWKEVELLYIPFAAFYINLFLAAFWSTLILLQYSVILSYYYNCWAKAFVFLKMRPHQGIKCYIRIHVFGFLIYVAILSYSFSVDWPVCTRLVFGQAFVLFFRQMWPGVRKIRKDDFFWCQLTGLLVYIYCVWVNRTLFMYLHQFSLILRNACYAWNLRFALRFQLIVSYYRAHIIRQYSNGTLPSIYRNHRLIVALCNAYGRVFLHPMAIYIVTNMGIAVIIMVYFIKYEDVDPATFNNTYTIKFKDTDAIVYEHLKRKDELTTVFAVLLQSLVDFVQGTLGIGWGADAIVNTFEFVRRQGLLFCNTHHERRLIYSLYMSFTNVRPPFVNADWYFGVSKEKIFAGLMMMAFFWTMIIQCQVEQPTGLIEWIPGDDERCKDLEIIDGYCMVGHRYRNKTKERLKKRRVQELLELRDNEPKYWFLEDCERTEFQWNNMLGGTDYGMCKIDFPEALVSKMKTRYPRFVNNEWHDRLKKRWTEQSKSKNWKGIDLRDEAYQKSNRKKTDWPCKFDNPLFDWKELYRDFYYPCPSKIGSGFFLMPVVFTSDKKPVMFQGQDCRVSVNTTGMDLRNCMGDKIVLDDCGSFNIPDFNITRLGVGKFIRHSPSKTVTMTISDMPPAYKARGLSETKILKCWDNFVGKQRCSDDTNLPSNHSALCMFGKHGVPFKPTNYGYLFGKDCYDFHHFTVFTPPNKDLLCEHPRFPNASMKSHWISKKEYDAYYEKEEIKIARQMAELEQVKQEQILSEDSGVSDESDNSRRKRDNTVKNTKKKSTNKGNVTTKKSKQAKKVAKKEKVEEDFDTQHISLKLHKKTGKSIFNESESASSFDPSADIPIDWQVGKYNFTRHLLFYFYFRCRDDKGKVIGWLPLPHVYPEQKVVTKGTLRSWRKGSCWENPYPRTAFGNNVTKIVDIMGNEFLDDCLNPWWTMDPNEFVPDDVFDKPAKNKIKTDENSCWEDVSPGDCGGRHCLHFPIEITRPPVIYLPVVPTEAPTNSSSDNSTIDLSEISNTTELNTIQPNNETNTQIAAAAA